MSLTSAVQAQMAPPERDPSMIHLASFYGVSRQSLYQLKKRHGLHRSTLESPSTLFIILTESGVSSLLRKCLSDPAEQARIQNLIYQWYADEHTSRIHQLREATGDSPRTVGAA